MFLSFPSSAPSGIHGTFPLFDMRTAKQPGPPPSPSAQPGWVKIAFAVEFLMILVLVPLLLDQAADARGDLAAKQREFKEKSDAVASLRRENENTVEFLTKFQNDAEFRDRVVRQHLGYAAPGEIIIRPDPPPRTDSAQGAK